MGDENAEKEKRSLVKRLSVKGEIDDELFNEFKKNLKGNFSDQKTAIATFFKNYELIPLDADDILIDFVKKDERVELIRLIAQKFADETARFSLKFELGLLEALNNKEDEVTQKLIETKKLRYKEYFDNISKVLAKSMEFYNKYNETMAKTIQSAIRQSYGQFFEIQKKINTQTIRDSIYEFNKLQKAIDKLYFIPYYSKEAITQISVPETTKSPIEEELIDELVNCPKGTDGWQDYQEICGKIIQHLFSPPLGNPTPQDMTDDGVHVRDFILQIPYDVKGFWGQCQIIYNSVGVVFEIKNKTKLLPNDIVVTSKYLNSKRIGNFGIIITREYPSIEVKHELERIWKEEDKLLVVITDKELIDMMKIKSVKDEPEKLIEKIIFDFRRSLD